MSDYGISKKEGIERLRSQLTEDRRSFLPHWKKLGEYLLPRRPRFNISDNNAGDRRNQKIIDNTGTIAARTQRSGMMGGVTSPARPWFRLTTPDAAMNEIQAVKSWLHETSNLMSSVFLRSNLYNVLPVLYGDMGTFGTAALYAEEDEDEVIRFYPFPTGSYMIAQNRKLKVDIFYREFELTVRQVVQMFGMDEQTGKIDWTNISDTVKEMWDQKDREKRVTIVHCIQPNDDWNPDALESKYKRYSSDYYERGRSNGPLTNPDGKFLRQSGYDLFPVLCPRWEVNGVDAWGVDCPGFTSLSDVIALQVAHEELATAIAKMANPPVTGPSALKNSPVATIPGGITYDDTNGGGRGFRPTYEVNPRVQELMLIIQDHQRRIREAYFADLFIAFANSPRTDRTATEVNEIKEEKLIALGPVLEQLNQDLLDPLIDIGFHYMMKRGMIPPPPPELEGVELKVEYVSIMAQAQKMIGISAVERYVNFIGGVARLDPTVLRKLDTQQLADVYADMCSVPPSIIRSDEDVEEMAQQAAAAEQRQAQMQNVMQTTQAAKNLGQADMSTNSALSLLTNGAA